MKRYLQSALFALMFLAGFGQALSAQSTSAISSIRVYSIPGGARFIVDGIVYNSSQTFLWPTGSKHTLQFPANFAPDGTLAGPYQESLDHNTRFTLSNWVLSNGVTPAGSDVTIVADPTITTVVMNTVVTYRVRLRFSNYPIIPPSQCSTLITPQNALISGLVIVGNICYGSDADFFASGGSLPVLAYPFPGFVFVGWATNGGPPVSYSGNVTLAGPITLVAQFNQAKRVRFRTDPQGFNVLVDRTLTPTTNYYGTTPTDGTCPQNVYLPPLAPITIAGLCFGDFDFIPGSIHTIGAPSPQYDTTGRMWIVDSFDNGLKPNDALTVSKNVGVSDTVTAKFVPGMQASFLTSPGGLKLNIDGRSNWFTYDFAWGVGSTHTVAAADQIDSKGRRWTFKGWSNGGSATQSISVSAPMRWTANFAVQPQVTLQSNPSGLTLQVDGATCVTPCTLDRPSGSIASVSSPTTIPISDSSRLVFTGWSDGASNTRAVPFDTDQRILTLNYQTQFRLAAWGDPAQGVTFTYDPPSADNYFAQDSGVSIKAQTKGGYRFRRWDGDLSGTFNQGTVVMGAPRNIVALLDRVPFITPAGIRNAAGTTPDGTIAPGSLISIAGESLTASYQAGRAAPLAQAIADVTVTVNGRLLPLVFVSPQEIRAQMLSDLADGDYALTVHSATMADVVGQFTVARNSPGLFPATVQPDPNADTPAGWATHADGTAVTSDSPAMRGETITVYGTGFGPVSGATFDGFPATSDFKLQDQLQIQTGDTTLDALWSGALGGQVGLMGVRFKITDALPTAATIKISVVVNGKSSNPVTLPLQ